MAERDPNASFHDLYKRHYRSVFGYFRWRGFSKEDAEDLTQETFVRVFRYMNNIRGSTAAEVGAYVRTAAASVRANTLRKASTLSRSGNEVSREDLMSPVGESTADLETGESAPSPEEELSQRQESHFQRKRLYQEVNNLPPAMRRCLMLRLEGLKYREIAEAMDISMDTVKSLLYSAKKQLVAKLGEEIDLRLRLEGSDD